MPIIPWVTPHEAPPDTTAFVMASRLETKSLKHVPRFFWQSYKAWKQVRTAPGALGASLEAQLTKGVFYTLSAWQDRAALYAYARTEPHKSIMTGLRPATRDSVFTFWEVPAGELPIDWADAKRRLTEEASTPHGHP
ncbi:DUF3291 domain-containing protein [Streptomyces sp. NPDC127108]|uniref:DUF3291 domain-containing protein n=1 Tax=Streptomyces sp. NPDC127108 TaxID=3345361 RepID=UPI0036331811